MAAGTVSLGARRSGYLELIRNTKAVDQIGFKAKPNPATESKVDEFAEGEWAIINADGQAANMTGATKHPAAYPVVVGKERFDVIGSKTTTLCIGQVYFAKTSGYRIGADPLGGAALTAADYVHGVALTAIDGLLQPARASGDYILATQFGGISTEQMEAERALGQTGTAVITVEVMFRGKV